MDKCLAQDLWSREPVEALTQTISTALTSHITPHTIINIIIITACAIVFDIYIYTYSMYIFDILYYFYGA